MSFSYYSDTNNPKYVFTQGARVKGGVEAQIVGEALARIADEEGGITPKAVVERARDESSPLHPCFTWNDRDAAELYRQDEARNLVRVVRVVADEEEAPVPAFVNVERVDEGAGRKTFSCYVRSSEAVASFDLFESALRSAQARLDSAKHSLAELERTGRIYGMQKTERLDQVKAALEAVTTAQAALAN